MQVKWGFPGGSVVRNLPAVQGGGFNPWVGKIPWRRNGSPLQYSCLRNPMDRGVWWATGCRVAKSQMGLSVRARACTHTHTHTHTHMQDSANIFSTKKNSLRLKTNFRFIILELNLFLGKIHFPP